MHCSRCLGGEIPERFEGKNMNEVAVYSWIEASANRARPNKIRPAIEAVLNSDPKCWEEMEPYLREPGVTGFRFYDQHAAVLVLRKYDELDKKLIEALEVTDRELWDHLYAVLGRVFDMRHGRINGLLAHTPPVRPSQAEQGATQDTVFN